ncbi:hypothetical protein B0H14DRAFT_2726864 [Mycena olivaceomarginata]|nr:hypothetical protein B0H14DRAFT_2726864 [Mycena olivaceomarginata]
MKLFALSALTALLVTSVHAQNLCATVPADVARQLTEMQTFNNRVPPSSSASTTDCTSAKSLKSGIDGYRSVLAANPASGCIGIYANLILTDGFNPQYTILGKFVAACVAAGH